MDIEDFISEDVRPPPVNKQKSGLILGVKFTSKEEEFVRANYQTMTDRQMACQLGRTKKSIEGFRSKNKLNKFSGAQGRRQKNSAGNKNRRAFLATLDDEEKMAFLTRELKRSALYKTFCKSYHSAQEYIKLYEQKYIEFMMDPTIETVTSMERDIWHEMTLAQIREMEYLYKEKEEQFVDDDGRVISKNFAKEIAQCQETIRKCQESLNVERVQRLKSGSDQAVSFTQVIKELRHPDLRRKAGEAAAMLKYIAEKHYNSKLGKNIISGSNEMYNINELFKDGKEPEGLDGNFTGEKEVREHQAGVVDEKEQALYAD